MVQLFFLQRFCSDPLIAADAIAGETWVSPAFLFLAAPGALPQRRAECWSSCSRCRPLRIGNTAVDIDRIVKAHKITTLLTIEGGLTIDDDLAMLRTYYRLGIRSMTLTHARNTYWADSASDTPAHTGLTDFGKEMVREMNRLGMLVDLTHVSDRTFYDAANSAPGDRADDHRGHRRVQEVRPSPRGLTRKV